MSSWTEVYSSFRFLLSEKDEQDKRRKEHLEKHYQGLKQSDIGRRLIDNDMLVYETIGHPENLKGHRPAWASELLNKLDKIKVVAAEGGDVEAEVEEIKGGFSFSGDDFGFEEG